MAFRHLLEGECGNSNSLVQLSSVLSRDGTSNSQMAGPSSRADQYIQEFVNQGVPQTFEMQALLQNVREIEGGTQAKTWSNEYKRFGRQPVQQSLPSSYNGWNSGRVMPMSPMMRNPFSLNAKFVQAPGASIEIQYLDQEEELQNSQTQVKDKTEDMAKLLREKSKGILNSVDGEDMDQAYSQFMSFMRQVSAGDASLGLQGMSSENGLLSSQDEQLDKLAETYKDEWAKLSDINDISWSPYGQEKVNPFKEYSFSEKNIMLDNTDALMIGKEKLRNGDIPGAVLCFEAAVKQNPGLSEAWLLLGSSQAENEQDPQAIAALSKCIEIDPSCLQAYMALSASYTNENYSHLAYGALLGWMKANPKYADFVPADVDTSSMDSTKLSEYTLNLYLKAVQVNPTIIDPDIQAALGVIFNIRREYSKAIDCFKTALMVKSDDSHLWNRLGATLANGERSEEAVEAYQRALTLEPGFIRARYNVGITCMNLGAYKEAAEHFLVALNQQDKARGVDSTMADSNVLSSTIWSTLRMVCAFMDKYDITSLIDERNLAEINKHFGI